MTRPKNPHKLAATRRKAGPHSGARRPDDYCDFCHGERVVRRWERYWDGMFAMKYETACPACSGEERGDG